MDKRCDVLPDGGDEAAPEGAVVVEEESADALTTGEGAAEGGPAVRREARRRRAAVGVAAALAVALVGGGIAYAVSRSPQSEEPARAQAGRAQTTQAAAEARDEKSEVSVAIKADAGEDATLTKVKVVAFDADGEEAVAETEVAANETVAIGELPKGDYELHVTTAPVAEDGSTYKLPDEPTAFEVDGSGEDVTVEVGLEKVAVDDMSKEQLEAASAVLEAAGKADAAQAAKAAAQDAPSVPGSAESVQRPATPSGGGSGGAGKPSGSGGGSGSGGSESGGQAPSAPSDPDPAPPSNPTVPDPEPPAPSEPPHTCTFEPITEMVWVPDGSMVPDYSAAPTIVYSCLDCGITFASADAWAASECAFNHHTESHPEYPLIPGGYYDYQTVGWSPCPVCGATK